VAVTLGNDTLTPSQLSTSYNTVDLQTQIDSFRIKAATNANTPLAGPFPYDLTVNEVDDIAFDAVAASSNPISLSAGGSISFNAALATAGDLKIAAGDNFTVSAPVSTSAGRIEISGDNVAVNNSLRVLNARPDDTSDDIVLSANAGDLKLTGLVSAVNNVRLVQRNKAAAAAGKIYGPSRVFAEKLSVEAEGGVTLNTDVAKLAGRSGGDFAVDELNDITIESLRAPGAVTLRAAGVDPGVGSSTSPNPIAITANLVDVVSLSASAPQGSIDIVTNTAKLLTLGNTAISTLAAGNVSIRSAAGPIAVLDAPVAGAAARSTRVASTGNLNATYQQNTPGTIASTLTLNVPGPLVIDGIQVRPNDRVLVMGQATASQNGVYTVTNSGTASTRAILTRSADSDTTTEIPQNTFVRVEEGSSSGKVFVVGFRSSLAAQTPIVATSVPNRPGATVVRVASTVTLPGTYSAAANTIVGSGALPSIDGVTLVPGDLVVVRRGTTVGGVTTQASNGVYVVTDDGTSPGPNWILTRAADPDTGLLFPVPGYVSVEEGTFRTSNTGNAFLLAFDSLGNSRLVVSAVNATGVPSTNIGTEDLNDVVTFVVSTTGATNAAAGSLGKMIRLAQENNTGSSTLNPSQKTELRFATVLPGQQGAPAGAIRLTQELPLITKPLTIDASNRYSVPGVVGATSKIVVDGSRIDTTRTGAPAASAAQINGFEFGPGSGAAGSKAGGSLSGLTVGGFSKGAAVKINGAPGILVNNVVLGRNETGDRLANMYGVLATNNTTGSSIVGSTIVGSTAAGVRVAATSNGITVVGSTIGVDGQNNSTGVKILGGNSRIGVDPVGSVVKAITTSASDQFGLPNTVSPAAVFVGQPITGTGIPAGTFVSAVNGSTLTLSKKMTATGSSNVTFGQPGRNAVQYNLNGIALNGGANTVTNTDVRGNTFDGIKIGGGTQSIGTSRVLGSNSNAVFGNGNWGVNMITPAVPTQQVIQAAYFGGPVKATAGNANALGNVAVNGALAPASLGFNPVIAANAVTATDGFGNQYVRPTGKVGNTNIKQPWRP
jgi:hypothetical protein